MRKALLLGVALALAFTGAAYAQETTSGTIAGQVLDPQGAAVPGATVTVTSPQGEKTYTTDAEGRFIAPFLVPAMYDVRVELTGFKTIEQKGIMVRLGQRSRLNFTLAVSQVQETVEVVGSSPVIDLSSTTAGGVMDSDMLKQLPVGRNFTQTLYLVPGVSDSSGVGAANPSIGGASGLENSYVVDGVNITSTGFGGVGIYTIVYGSLGTGVTTDFIKETQVKTAGFEAEYGQASGGVVNVVTKSGTNQFHGSLFGYHSPEWLEASWDQLQTPNGTINTTESVNSDVGVTAGGPIIKDKLFAFGAFNPQYATLTRVAPQGFPLESLGPQDRNRTIYSYAGKLTWQASANHRFDASFFGDPSKGEMGPQRGSSLLGENTDAYSELTSYGGHNMSIRYDGILTPNWFIEGSVARAKFFFEELPSVDEWQTRDFTVTPTGRSGGIGFYEANLPGQNLQFTLKSTNIVNAGGTHQFRYGVQYDDIEYTRGTSRTGPTFTLSNGVQTRTGALLYIQPAPELGPNGKYYNVIRANYGPEPLTTQQYLNWFAQDTWQLNNNFTIKAGIRWERQTLVGSDDPALCFDDEVRVGDGGSGNGNPIACEYTWTNNWSPRVGAIWDPTGNGKAKIYANWGRFYVKIPNDLAARALSADAGVSRADYYDANLTQPIPEGVLVGGQTRHLIIAGAHPALFENDTKSTYTDEFLGGMEFEAAPMLNLGVRFIYRNLSTVLEDYAPVTPVDYSIPTSAGLGSVEYTIDNITADIVTADTTAEGVPRSHFEDPEHKYYSVEVTATKAYSDNWSLFASYRWSKLEGNFEGFFRSDNGQSDPSITSLFDFPTNDPSYTQIGVPVYGFGGDIRYQGTTQGVGRLPNDRTHQLKLYGNYTLGDLNLGLGLNLGSGRILTGLAANPAYGNAGEIPLTLRGEGFDTVDGFLTNTDFETVVNVHASYTIRLGTDQRLMLIADVFNLLNDQSPLWYDTDQDQGFGAPNPNFGQPSFGGNSAYPAYRAPLSTRLGVRFEW
jgi:hypothetical protein